MKSKFIDIVCATYNCKNKIPTLVSTIRKLDLTIVNLLICDGGSTDGTFEELLKIDGIRIIDSAKDNGIYDAWNKCLKFVCSKYVTFIGVDDFVNPNFLMAAYEKYYENVQPAVFYGNAVIKYLNYTRIIDTPLKPLLLSNNSSIKFDLVHQGLLIRSDLLFNYIFSLDYKLSSDLIFFHDKRDFILKFGYFKIQNHIQSEIDFSGMSTTYKAFKIYKTEHKKIFDLYGIKIITPFVVKIGYYLSFDEWSFNLIRIASWNFKKVVFGGIFKK